MEKSQPTVNFNFASRAAKLRTAKQQAIVQQQQLQQAIVPKDKFWREQVRTKEDVMRYYEIYYPEYPKELIVAIANRLENLLYKYNSGKEGRGNLTEAEKQMISYFAKPKDEVFWDPLKDIEDEKLAGKIELTSRRLEQLIAE